MIEPTRPNFFLLLELNPDEPWDSEFYHKALQEKIRQWSRDSMSVAKKALPAQANRTLLPSIRRVMENPASRDKEAEEARKLLATRYQAAHAHFEKQLMLLNLKEVATQEEVERFIRDFKRILPAQEIRKLITIKIQPLQQNMAQLSQPLDASVTENIEDRLAMLHMQTLYEFLASPRKSTTTTLFKAAKALYANEVRKHPTAEVTVRIELAGFAMNLFKTNETRARYDETLRQRSLQQLLQDITESVKRSEIKEVHPKQVLYYLKKAEEAGWSEKEALDQLKERGRIQQWFITHPQQRVEKPDGATSAACPVEPTRLLLAGANNKDVHQSHLPGTMRSNARRRGIASSLILLQLICLTALLQSKPDPLQALRQVFTWGNQAHNALLAFSVESFQHYAQTQLTAYISATILHNGVAVLSFLLTLLINVLCISLILTPGIPILCMVIGLLSGSFIGLKNLGKTLLTAHLQLSAQRKAMRKKGLTLQPAQKSYPFEQGWNIESVAAEEIANTFHKLKHKWSTAADLITDWKWKRNRLIRYWVRLIQIGCQIAGLIQSILALEIGALSACLYTTLLLLWDAGALLCIGVLSIMQVLHPRLHTHLLSCPSCHHEIAAPISICAACITECPQRRPGFYGIFWYRCQGCGTKLPTLDFYGSRSFTHLCPHCRHVLKP